MMENTNTSAAYTLTAPHHRCLRLAPGGRGTTGGAGGRPRPALSCCRGGLVLLFGLVIAVAPVVGDIEPAALKEKTRPAAEEPLELAPALRALGERLGLDRLGRLVFPSTLLTLILVRGHHSLMLDAG